jgi:transforming growth factor-beta-induced protein
MKKIGKILSVLLIAFVMIGVLAPVTMAKGPKDIYSIADLVVANPDVDGDEEGDFDILLSAVLAADEKVLKALSSRGQYTVFAPTDAAFASLLGELGLTSDQLLSDQDLVTDVLLYHVVRGRRYSMDILDSDRIRTMEGGFLFQYMGELTDENGRTSEIIATDIEADNGVIHVIDTVVLPK